MAATVLSTALGGQVDLDYIATGEGHPASFADRADLLASTYGGLRMRTAPIYQPPAGPPAPNETGRPPL